MNPEQESAMQLLGATDGFLQDDPNADYEGESPETWAARGVAEAHQYMAKNGPIQPTHRAPKTMTKAQLEEQKMNENQGYPSNLDEAEKTKQLEQRVSGMETGISQILQHLQNNPPMGGTNHCATAERVPPDEVPIRYHRDGSIASRPAVLSSPVSTPQGGRNGGTQVSPAEVPIVIPAPSVTATPRSPNSTASSGLLQPKNKPQQPREVTLSSGKKVMVPQSTSTQAMNLGPATDAPQKIDDLSVDEELWDEQLAIVPEVEEEPKADPKLEKVANMVLQVNQFMASRDVHRDFRRLLASHIHRHLGYSGWPKPIQAEFDTRFKGFLSDPQFVTSICRKIYDMDMGYALGVKPVVSFLVASAGFTAFTLIGLD